MNGKSSEGLSSIDKLMMTYVDLSGSSGKAKSSFKGPPLKDLKPLYQSSGRLPAQPLANPSQKSIDWKAFDGSFLKESLFDKEDEEEEWGDFRCSQLSSNAISPNKDTKENKKESDDDDFSDFISLRASTRTQDELPSIQSLDITDIPESQNYNTIEAVDKCFSAFKDLLSLDNNNEDPPVIEKISSSSSSEKIYSKRSSTTTDFLALSPEPLSQPICQSPIPFLSTGISDSSFNILHLHHHSSSSPPELMAPTSNILGPSPLPDPKNSLMESSDGSSSSCSSSYSGSMNHPSTQEPSFPRKSSFEDPCATSQSAFQCPPPPPPSEDRYRAFREAKATEEVSVNPLAQWLELLRICHGLLRSGADTFHSIEGEALLEEVLSSHRTRDYIINLIEVYRVSRRVQASFRSLEEVDVSVELYGQIKEEHNRIDKAWCSLLEKARTKEVEEALYLVLLENGMSLCKRGDYLHCGICCSLVTPFNEEEEMEDDNNERRSKWNDAFCKYGSRQYHSSCANLWLNCVEPTLPDL